MEFKEGDMVRLKRNCSGATTGVDYVLYEENGSLWAGGKKGIFSDKCYCKNKWILVEQKLEQPKKTIMQKVSVMMKKLLDGDTQTLVKASYIDGNLDLTEEGTDALLAILFDENKAAMVNAAQEVIDEEEKD